MSLGNIGWPCDSEEAWDSDQSKWEHGGDQSDYKVANVEFFGTDLQAST